MLKINEEFLVNFFDTSKKVMAEWDNYPGHGKVPTPEVIDITYTFFESLKGWASRFSYKKQFSEIEALRTDKRLYEWQTALIKSKLPSERKTQCLSYLGGFYSHCSQLLVKTIYNPLRQPLRQREEEEITLRFTGSTPLIRADIQDDDVKYLARLLRENGISEITLPTGKVVYNTEPSSESFHQPPRPMVFYPRTMPKPLYSTGHPFFSSLQLPQFLGTAPTYQGPPELKTLPPSAQNNTTRLAEIDDLLDELDELEVPTGGLRASIEEGEASTGKRGASADEQDASRKRFKMGRK